MAIALDISTGQIDAGDTKALEVTPKTPDGTTPGLTSLDVTLTAPDGTTITYVLNDWTENSGTWSVDHTWDQGGMWKVKIEASNGVAMEVEQDFISVT